MREYYEDEIEELDEDDLAVLDFWAEDEDYEDYEDYEADLDNMFECVNAGQCFGCDDCEYEDECDMCEHNGSSRCERCLVALNQFR